MPITEEILKKFNIEIDDTLEKNEDGTFKLDQSLDRIFAHGLSMGKQDPEFLKSVKETASKESSIITKKKIVKSLRDAFSLELTNAEIESLEPDQIADMIKKTSTAKSTDDVAKIQADLMKIANEKKALEDRYDSDIEKIKNEYSEKERAYAQKRSITKIFRNPDSKFVVSEDVALLIFESKLKEDGLTIKYEDGKPVVYKGDTKALTDNNTTTATLEYLAGKYWADIMQKSNGNGGDSGSQRKPADKDYIPSESTKKLMDRFGGKRGG